MSGDNKRRAKGAAAECKIKTRESSSPPHHQNTGQPPKDSEDMRDMRDTRTRRPEFLMYSR
jgi:hypothetical protein